MTTANDFLSSATVDIWDLIEEATRNDARAKKKDEKKKDIFYIETLPNKNIKDEKLNKPSRVKVSIELVPVEE